MRLPAVPRHRHAFTLIELMIVVMLIAMLMTLILTAMDAIKAKAQIAQCAGNLRQVQAAAIHDAEETDGYLMGWMYRTSDGTNPNLDSNHRGKYRTGVGVPGGYDRHHDLTLRTSVVLPGGTSRLPAGTSMWGLGRLRRQMEDESIVYCPASFSSGGARSLKRDLGGDLLVTTFLQSAETDTPAEAQADYVAEGRPTNSSLVDAMSWGYVLHTWKAPTWADRFLIWNDEEWNGYLGCKPWGLRNRYDFAASGNDDAKPTAAPADPRAALYRGIAADLIRINDGAIAQGGDAGRDTTTRSDVMDSTLFAVSLGSAFVYAGDREMSGVSNRVPVADVVLLSDWTRPLAYRGTHAEYLFSAASLDAGSDLNAIGSVLARADTTDMPLMDAVTLAWMWNHRDGGNVAFLDGRVVWLPMPFSEIRSDQDKAAQRWAHHMDRSTVRWFAYAPKMDGTPLVHPTTGIPVVGSMFSAKLATGTTGAMELNPRGNLLNIGSFSAMPMNY